MDLCVFLSNRCNLLCSYCTILLNEGPAHYLDAAAVVAAVERYLEGAGPADRGVVYLGGEPLLRPALLREVVTAVTALRPPVSQHLYTNGLLLTAELYAFLRAQGVCVTLSLDGKKRSNDRYRVFYGRAGSSWSAVMDRVRGLALGGMAINMVFTPETVGSLTENVEFGRRAGFGQVDFNPDTCNKSRIAGWDAPALRSLRAASEELAAYLEGLLERGQNSFDSPHLSFFPKVAREATAGAWWRRFESVILGADGYFYPCESLFQFPYETLAAFRMGSAARGVDWARQRVFAREARAFVDKSFSGRRHFSCPMNVYFYAKRAGTDPAPLIRGLLGVFDALSAPLIRLAQRRPGLLGTSGALR